MFVASDDVVAMLFSMAPDDARSLDERFPIAKMSDRACPKCNSSMSEVKLDAVVLDRCPTDGIWFDRNELAKSLESDGNHYTARNDAISPVDVVLQPMGVVSHLFYKLFTAPNRPRDLNDPKTSK